MSSASEPTGGSFSVTDAIAGLMAAGSFVLSALAAGLGLVIQVDSRPAVLAPVAAVVALVAARMSTHYQRLALIAVLAAVVAWTVGMTLAVITENPII
jgi:hypothetical protein